MMISSKAAAPSACSIPLPISPGRGGTFAHRRYPTPLLLQHRHRLHYPLGLRSIVLVNPRRHRHLPHPLASTGTAQDGNGSAGAAEGSPTDPGPEFEPEESGQVERSPDGQQSAAADATAEAIKEKLVAARAASSGDAGEGFWGGVVEEVGRIEWPEFGKVLGTTWVVISVIAGSSVALLTVNAILAELSDRVFAGRGVQDFFGG